MVVVDAEVSRGQSLEPVRGEVGHVYVHVHPPRPEQCRVEFVFVVRGEYDDPLVATARPQAIDEVQQPRQCELQQNIIVFYYH